jgi:hypothetical protein
MSCRWCFDKDRTIASLRAELHAEYKKACDSCHDKERTIQMLRLQLDKAGTMNSLDKLTSNHAHSLELRNLLSKIELLEEKNKVLDRVLDILEKNKNTN